MVSKILILLHGSQYGHKLRREGPRQGAKHNFFLKSTQDYRVKQKQWSIHFVSPCIV